LAAADEETALALILTPGERHDAPVAKEVFKAVPEACPVKAAVLDKAYDSDDIRNTLKEEGIKAVIPSKRNRVAPIPHDKKLYRRRNCVERLVGKLKQFRAVATRYDKLACTFMAFIHVVAAFVMAR
jgi:transposase